MTPDARRMTAELILNDLKAAVTRLKECAVDTYDLTNDEYYEWKTAQSFAEEALRVFTLSQLPRF